MRIFLFTMRLGAFFWTTFTILNLLYNSRDGFDLMCKKD